MYPWVSESNIYTLISISNDHICVTAVSDRLSLNVLHNLHHCLYSHWCKGVYGGGTLSKEGLLGFGSTSLQTPEIPGSGLPGFQSDL